MKISVGRDAGIVLGIFAVIIVLGLIGGRGRYGKSSLGMGEGSAQAEHAFAPGGSVSLDLEAGDYEIVRGSDDKIVASGVGKNADKDVRVSIDVNGNSAHVVTQTDKEGNGHFRIELPAKSDIDLHLTAGDLDISGIEGNKDIESKAGDVKIEVGDASKYGDVEASSLAGDITAAPFGKTSSGVGNHFSWSGTGPYHLRVHMLAGDLVLR